MPSRHYRVRLRSTSIQPRFISKKGPSTILYENKFQNECEDPFQLQLFSIVDVITQRLEITEITTQVNSLVKTLSTPEQLTKLLDTVENISIGIIQNLTDGVDIGIIRCRIDYLRTLIVDIPDEAQEEYCRVGELILGVLSMITEGIDQTIITDKITGIKTSVDVYANRFSVINEIQIVIYSIIQNITDGVDIGIIRCRIDYLTSLIGKLPEGAQEEYSKVGELILQVLNMITEGVDFNVINDKIRGIQTSVSIYDIVDEIKILVCSIVQNITDGVDIGIIRCRIDYLNSLIKTIPPDV
jgi:hypothetical protein